MIFQYYGIDTDPQRLTISSTPTEATPRKAGVYWEKAALLAPDRVKHVYEDLPSYYLIDTNLARGNPVIVKIKLLNGITHFVVIAGKDGWDYLIRDPATGGRKGIYPLKDLGQQHPRPPLLRTPREEIAARGQTPAKVPSLPKACHPERSGGLAERSRRTSH